MSRTDDPERNRLSRRLSPRRLVARALASLLNPVLYPEAGMHLVLSQEEVGLLAGVSRGVANRTLKALCAAGALKVEYGSITVMDLDQLRGFG